MKETIEAGKVASVYFLSGDDEYGKKEFIAGIRRVLNPDEFNYFSGDASRDDMGEILSSANTAPAFSNVRMVVLNNADKIRKGSAAARALAAYLANPLESTCFAVCHNDAQKAKKDKDLLNACCDKCEKLNFDPPSGTALAAWTAGKLKERGLEADSSALETLEELVGGNLNALASEIEKLSLLTRERADKKISAGDVLESVGFDKEKNPFALSYAVINLNRAEALRLIDALLAAREEPPSILNKISMPVVKMLKIKRLSADGYQTREIMSLGGLMPWESRLAQRAANMPSARTLANALDKIIEADAAFKSSSSCDPAITLKGIIMSIIK